MWRLAGSRMPQSSDDLEEQIRDCGCDPIGHACVYTPPKRAEFGHKRRTMSHSLDILKSATFILIILSAAGCQVSPGDRGGAPADADLVGAEWQLVRIEAPEATVRSDDLARDVTLEFTADEHDRDEGGRLVTGHAPCNGFSAAYRTEGERSISFDDIVSTFIACEDDIMMHERLLFQGLEEATAYTIEGSTLQITSENISLTYEAS